MQDETKSIPRLDRSKPPPGWGEPFELEHHGCWHAANTQANYTTNCADNKAGALAKAWGMYEDQHDAPGMRIYYWIGNDPDATHLWYVAVDAGPAVDGGVETEQQARAEAWAWYWRRVGIVGRLDAMAAASKYLSCVGVFKPGDLWPNALTWSNDHVSAIEGALRGKPVRIFRETT